MEGALYIVSVAYKVIMLLLTVQVSKANQNSGTLQPVSYHVHPSAYKYALTTQAQGVSAVHTGTQSSHLVTPAPDAYEEQQCMSYGSTQWPVTTVSHHSLQPSEQVLAGSGSVHDRQVTARVCCGTSVSTSLPPFNGDSGTSLRSMAGDSGTSLRSMQASDSLVVAASQKSVKSGCDANKTGLSAARLNDLR